MNIKGPENYKNLAKIAILVSLISSTLFFILTKSANTQSSSIILSIILSFILGIIAIGSISFGLILGVVGSFKYKNYEVFIIFILLFVVLIFLPHRFISKQQKEKSEMAKISIERMEKEAKVQKDFIDKLNKVYKSHYDYYLELFSKPQRVIDSKYTNVFILENGLEIYIITPTVIDKSFLNKNVEIRLGDYDSFKTNYKIFDDYINSKIMDASDEALEQYINPTDPIWKNKVRIPVEIFYEGRKIDS